MIDELLSDLVDYIKNDIWNNHYDTGALHDSMEANFNFLTGEITFSYNDYMKYLDEGTYFQSVLDSPGAQSIIEQIYATWLEGKVDEKLKEEKTFLDWLDSNTNK